MTGQHFAAEVVTMVDSNLGKWDHWYRDLSWARGPEFYGDTTTYLIAAAFLADLKVVEDWGCGKGGFRDFCLTKYVGVDGSKTPFADKIADLCTYRCDADGILLRHVLEHNYSWSNILESALTSFRSKLCIVLFTPFSEQTKEIAHNRHLGVDAPDLSFRKEDIEAAFDGIHWKLIENIKTKSQYDAEHVYLLWH